MLNQFNDWIVDLGMNDSRLLRLMKASDGRDVMSFSERLQKGKNKVIVWRGGRKRETGISNERGC